MMTALAARSSMVLRVACLVGGGGGFGGLSPGWGWDDGGVFVVFVEGVVVVVRSALFVPGVNERALVKVSSLGVDAVIVDLEDAVAPDQKVVARGRACAAVSGGELGGDGRVVAVRVNGVGTPWHEEDVTAVLEAGVDVLVLPKAERVVDVCSVVEAASARGAAVWLMVESARGVLAAAEMAQVGDGVRALIAGTNDLAAELRCDVTAGRGALQVALQQIVLAARSGGCLALDGVFNAVKDVEGFVAEAREGRVLGFDGKTILHPAQVEPCREVFSPSDVECEYAKRVVEAFEAALERGDGVALLDGSLIENLHVDAARRVLAQCVD